MLHWSLIFLVVAIIAGLLGFGGIAGAAAGIAKILFVVFLAIWILALLLGARQFEEGLQGSRSRGPHSNAAAKCVYAQTMSYQPIADYGVIGDLQSVALVGKNGSIDWCCLPRFDSPSIFGALLDDTKGGSFRLFAIGARQMYLPDTNILVTRFMSDGGMAEVTDFMSIGRDSGGPSQQQARQLIRLAKVIHGRIQFRMECRPAFDYARRPHTVEVHPDGRSLTFAAGGQEFALKSTQPLSLEATSAVAEFSLQAGEGAAFAVRHSETASGRSLHDEPLDAERLLSETARFWRNWAAQNQYHGRWRETVRRSALVLKLLSYAPTGAIVAAATTSLLELLGGTRNWDYRYTWVRDAAFTVYSLIRLGYTEEAAAFARFMQQRAREVEKDRGPLNVMYGIDGRHDLREETLDHLKGYCDSRPVRVGNNAFQHLQLDIYGELLDSLYLHDKYGTPVSYEMWTVISSLLDWVARNWDQPDQSIWEVRGGCRDFTYSKLQCWVALDRGLRLARKRSLPVRERLWEAERDRIYKVVMSRSWNERMGSFTQYLDGDAIDASSLMILLLRFASPSDSRVVSTIREIRRQLASGSLVRRYEIGTAAPDGLPGEDGYFTVCSFWLVEAMARAGDLEEAQLLFEKLLSFSNHLGLFSEEISSTGDLIGNFPQALVHLGLVSAAYSLNRSLDEGKYRQE